MAGNAPAEGMHSAGMGPPTSSQDTSAKPAAASAASSGEGSPKRSAIVEAASAAEAASYSACRQADAGKAGYTGLSTATCYQPFRTQDADAAQAGWRVGGQANGCWRCKQHGIAPAANALTVPSSGALSGPCHTKAINRPSGLSTRKHSARARS
jgi:hypothetical protein